MTKIIADEDYAELYDIMLDLATVFENAQYTNERQALRDVLVKKHQLLSSSSRDFWAPTEEVKGRNYHTSEQWEQTVRAAAQAIRAGRHEHSESSLSSFARDLLVLIAAATLVLLDEHDERQN